MGKTALLLLLQRGHCTPAPETSSQEQLQPGETFPKRARERHAHHRLHGPTRALANAAAAPSAGKRTQLLSESKNPSQRVRRPGGLQAGRGGGAAGTPRSAFGQVTCG